MKTGSMRSPELPCRSWVAVAISIGVVVVMTVGMLSALEWIYLVNGTSYPRWLAQGELGRVNDADILRLRATECKHAPVEVFPKDGFVVLRCGMMFYEPSTKTFIADAYAFGGQQGGGESQR